MLHFLFLTALDWAMSDRRMAHLLWPFDVLLLVGFEALLRPGELAGLRVGDVRPPGPLDAKKQAVLAIRSPKTKFFYGRAQFALVASEHVVSWLAWLIHGLPRHSKIFPSSLERFRALFKAVCSRAGLSQLQLTPASLRAGGTKFLVTGGADLLRVKMLGRWRSEHSMSCYVQEAVAQLVWLNLTAAERSRIEEEVASFQAVLSSPPRVPWCLIFSRRLQWRMMAAARKRRGSRR